MADPVNLPIGNFNDPIPAIIHQTWKTNELPVSVVECQKTWLEFHPNYQYRLWTDHDNYELIATDYPWFLEYYTKYPHNIQRADAARYFILHKFGGIYADLDMQCLTNFDPLLEKMQGIVVGHEGQVHKDGTQRIGNALIMSCPLHPFWIHVFQELMARFDKSDPLRISCVLTTTGPSFLHEVYLKHPQGVMVMPVYAFYPMSWHEPEEHPKLVLRKQYPRSWTVHHWTGLWRKSPRQIPFRYQDQYHDFSYYLILRRELSDNRGPIEKGIMQQKILREKLLETWSQMLKPDDIVIVVGAYNGYMTIPLAKMVPEGQVHAYEPDNHSRELLLESSRVNNLSHLQIYNCMPTAQTVPMYRTSRPNPLKPHHIIWRAQQPTGIETCMGVALNAMIVENVALIHIDVCGEEYSVLTGAQELIDRDRPILTIDIWTDERRAQYQTPLRQDQTFSLLDRMGYTYAQVEQSTYLCVPESE